MTPRVGESEEFYSFQTGKRVEPKLSAMPGAVVPVSPMLLDKVTGSVNRSRRPEGW